VLCQIDKIHSDISSALPLIFTGGGVNANLAFTRSGFDSRRHDLHSGVILFDEL